MTKVKKDDYVSVYYGIHMDTFEVQSVWVTHGGSMSCGTHTHTIMPGRNIRFEIMIIYNLADLISFPPYAIQDDYAKKSIDDLKVKATEMKKGKNANVS